MLRKNNAEAGIGYRVRNWADFGRAAMGAKFAKLTLSWLVFDVTLWFLPTEIKRHLAACDICRPNDLDGRGALSEEELLKFTGYFLRTGVD